MDENQIVNDILAPLDELEYAMPARDDAAKKNHEARLDKIEFRLRQLSDRMTLVEYDTGRCPLD